MAGILDSVGILLGAMVTCLIVRHVTARKVGGGLATAGEQSGHAVTCEW